MLFDCQCRVEETDGANTLERAVIELSGVHKIVVEGEKDECIRKFIMVYMWRFYCGY